MKPEQRAAQTVELNDDEKAVLKLLQKSEKSLNSGFFLLVDCSRWPH